MDNQQINNNGNYNNFNNYNNQIVNLHIDNDTFTVNVADVNRYSILQHFADPNFNIGNTNSDYINIMKELKDSIISCNNNRVNNQEILRDIFCKIFYKIIRTYQHSLHLAEGKNLKTYGNLNVVLNHYGVLLERNNNITEDQLNSMCRIFKNILENKYDVELDIMLEKNAEKNKSLDKMLIGANKTSNI